MHPRATAHLALALAALAPAGCNTLRDCIPAPGSDPDYADPAFWACRPDVDGDACDVDLRASEVLADGSVQVVDHQPAADPPIDCFYVYPTVDLRLGAGLHDDLDDHENPDRTIGIQAARFSAACRVFAPYYRQVTIGTYSARERVREACFDVAYEDVLAAFERYLAVDNQGRGFVLVSHSQGSQITSRLLRERIEGDPAVHARLVAALPIGWSLATDAGGLTGGSFADTPVCRSADELGCVVGYRTYAAGNEFPVENDDFREGPRSVCVHPGDPGGDGPAPLAGAYFPVDLDDATWPAGVDPAVPYVLYRDYFEAQCVTQGDLTALEVRPHDGDPRTNPLDFSAKIVAGTLGTHIYDVQFGLGDLVDLVGVKATAYANK